MNKLRFDSMNLNHIRVVSNGCHETLATVRMSLFRDMEPYPIETRVLIQVKPSLTLGDIEVAVRKAVKAQFAEVICQLDETAGVE